MEIQQLSQISKDMIFVTLLDAERESQMKAVLWKLTDKKRKRTKYAGITQT